MTITLRLTKGSELTHAELDGNFTDLDGRLTTAAAEAASALQPSDIAAGTITPAPADFDLSGGATGFVLTKQAGGAWRAQAQAGGGDMAAATYDPQAIADDAFDMANMVEAANAKIMTAAERTKLAGLGSPPFTDGTALVMGSLDTTKLLRLEVDGLTTGVTRVVSPPDRNWTPTIFGSELTEVADAAAGRTKLVVAANPVPNAQLATMGPITVKANASGGTATPTDVNATAFKAAFGFGTLADLDNVTVSDISAGGTPDATKFLRGDGQWAGIIAAVAHQTIDLDNATTTTSAHAKFTISGGQLVITQLRLRNSASQAAPVRITLADTDAATPAGAEFDLLRAADQTGPCVIRPETSGSINGKGFATTNVASSAWANASGTNVDISNLPTGANTEGDIFEVRNHSTSDNNGFYRKTGAGTTCEKLHGNNPANAAAEAVDFDTGWTALAAGLATAVIIIDGNPGSAPAARIEGETREPRTIAGLTTFTDKTAHTGALDVDGNADFSAAVSLSGSGSLNAADLPVTRALLGDTAETFFDAGNKSGAASFDYTQGAWQKCVLTANVSSVAITNPPATGRTGTIVLEVHQDGTGGRTIAWGSAFRFPGGTDFTASSPAGAIDIWVFTTREGGSIWYGAEMGKGFAA